MHIACAVCNTRRMSDNLKTAAEVAQEAGVSIATVSREVARGNLKAEWEHPGPNGLRLFTPAEVERWIASRAVA